LAEEKNITYRFLDLYKELEELLTAKYRNAGKKYSSVIMRFINEPEGRRFSDELDVCREIRNLLSHHSDIGGEAIVEPSAAVVKALEEIVDTVKNPPTALKIATPASKLLTADRNTRLAALIEKMDKRGFSHIPVMEENKVVGVFSISTVFSYIKEYREAAVKSYADLRMEDFGEFLNIDKHTSETFRFVAANADIYDIQSIFNAAGPDKKRVAAVFVTSGGSKNTPLLGMITPWDLIRCFE